MKPNNIMISVLWISLLAITPSTQAGNDEILRGFMGIMQEMQKQSGQADPDSKAVMDAFGKVIESKGDRDDRQRKGKGDRDRQGKGKGDRDDRQGKGKGDRDRQGKGKKRQAKDDRQRRQN